MITQKTLLSCHQEFLLDELRGRWSFSLEAELEMADDLIDGLRIFDEGDDTHLGMGMGVRSCFLLLLIQTQFIQTGKKQDLTPLFALDWLLTTL